MKNPSEKTKVAGSGVKVLPVDQIGDASEKNLPSPILLASARGAERDGTDLNSSFTGGDRPLISEDSLGLNALDLPSLADARMRALDRTHDMMSLHSMRLVESKMDALSVIIKPAIGTELSLELHQRDGQVEAHATLLRGDRELLAQHWTELQHRLDQRGVKLADLTSDGSFSSGDHRQFQQPESSQEEVAQQASAFAEFAATSPFGGASARLATVHDGWESWA